MLRQWMIMALVVLAVASAACRSRRADGAAGAASVEPEGAGEPAPRVPFELRADSTDLTMFWFDEHGRPHSASRVGDVPEARRERVRVEPPRPEQRAAGWVFVADLRAAGRDGTYSVHAVSSEAFANDLAGLSGLAQAMAAPPPAGQTGHLPTLAPVLTQAPSAQVAQGGSQPASNAHIVIYGASWCGACHQAAAYLRSQGIPFIEHDIEHEPQAAAEMYQRAQQQGVPTGSIPIIDINGRLMVGFSAEAIQQAIRGS